MFMLPHLVNPEAIAGDWLTVFSIYFVGTGLIWAVVSFIDGTTELAIGAHFANNIAAILVINPTGTVLTTPSLFSITKYHATFNAIGILLQIPLFLVIVFGLFRREEVS
jgi:hypothetical protein